MVDRFVFLKLVDDLATDAGRAEVAAESARQLAAVPGVQGVVARVAADAASQGSWDVSLVVSFASVDDVGPYLVHPAHVAYRDWLAPRMTFLKAWNFRRV